MQLQTVTITGADDAVETGDLLELQQEFPFVEWGILLSRSAIRQPVPQDRYPTLQWIQRVQQTPNLRLAAHVCGFWVKQIGQGIWPADLDVSWAKRCQLNVALCMDDVSTIQTVAGALSNKQTWIIQVGADSEQGIGLARGLAGKDIPIQILMDASSGRGVPITNWPGLQSGIFCGVAGGLTPENLLVSLRAMEAVYDVPIWIDMESGVRTQDASGKERLDLHKVRQVLQIAKEWIAGE